MIKILSKIKQAATPERFTTDFLETKLGCRGGTDREFISLAKKLNLLNSDGTPTEHYKSYRNPGTSAAAIGRALKHGYRELFQRNEHADALTRDKLKGLVVEVTGLEPTNRVVNLVCQTFDTLKAQADFNGDTKIPTPQDMQVEAPAKEGDLTMKNGHQDFSLGLSYTINLVLPKSDDPAVFNAIFRSLRENLLKR